MTKVIDFKNDIEFIFGEMFKTYQFKELQRENYEITYSNGQCNLIFFSEPYELLISLKLAKPRMMQKVFGIYQKGKATEQEFVLWCILECMNLGKLLNDFSKASNKNLSGDSYTEEKGRKEIFNYLILVEQILQKNLAWILNGDFSFASKYQAWVEKQSISEISFLSEEE